MNEEEKKHAEKCPLHGYIEEYMVRAPDCTCDGYHTFDELYDHRITLYIALCRIFAYLNTDYKGKENPVWRSSYHSDGSQYEGWFILGIDKEKGMQITYHIPMSRWFETGFAQTIDRAPDFDGHTSQDVLTRIKNL